MEIERRVQDDIQVAETGQRGYLITHDPVFLNGYSAYAKRIPGDLKALRDLTQDNPSQQARAGRLEKLIQDRLRSLEAATRLGPALMAHPPPVVIQALARGRQQMSGVRAEVAAGLAEEQRLLAERDSSRRRQESLAITFALAAAMLTLAVLLAAAILLVRNNVSLAAAERARANEAAILQATLETIREGIAYFTSEGLLCAFNANFFRLLDLPERLAVLQKTRLSDLLAVEAGRPQQILSPPTDGVQDVATHRLGRPRTRTSTRRRWRPAAT